MANSIGKINIASLRVLRTLLCLFEENLSMKDLIARLNQAQSGTYNNFVVSKYINTCKSCGIDIQKIGDKYTIINFPLGMKFSAEETKLIYELKLYSENLQTSKTGDIISKFINKLHLTFFKASNGLPSSSNFRIIKMFEKACRAKCKIQIIYNDKSYYNCFPKDIKVVNGKIVFHTFSSDELKKINPDDIMDIRIIDQKEAEQSFDNVAVFELYGSLARRYQLRENEQMIGIKDNGAITILNKYEDKDTLLHRLMRYDSSCKIIKPASYVKEMRKLINNTIKNYKKSNE